MRVGFGSVIFVVCQSGTAPPFAPYHDIVVIQSRVRRYGQALLSALQTFCAHGLSSAPSFLPLPHLGWLLWEQ